LRLRGDYLAIVTLGFGEIIPRFFLNGDNIFGYNLTNGTIGIKGIDSPGIPFLPESLNTWRQFGTLDLNPWYYTILVLVLVTIFVNIRLRDSRLGRAWMAVREDETAAAAMGVNLVTTKLWAYALGATFGGLAGAFYGAFIKSIFPTSFSFNISVLVLCMVILGGMGNIYGVILGRHPPCRDQLLLPAAGERVGACHRRGSEQPPARERGHPQVQLLPLRRPPGGDDAPET
jgi:branched-chain amino acid transport system permease protein